MKMSVDIVLVSVSSKKKTWSLQQISDVRSAQPLMWTLQSETERRISCCAVHVWKKNSEASPDPAARSSYLKTACIWLSLKCFSSPFNNWKNMSCEFENLYPSTFHTGRGKNTELCCKPPTPRCEKQLWLLVSKTLLAEVHLVLIYRAPSVCRSCRGGGIAYIHTPRHFTQSRLFSPADVDECVTNTHSCRPSERCVNTVGSFVCELQVTCPAGYQLRNGVCEGEFIVPDVFH